MSLFLYRFYKILQLKFNSEKDSAKKSTGAVLLLVTVHIF